jgi:Tfp pilus assembly protein PilN
MRPVNLMPPEDRRGEHAPMRTGYLAYAVLAGLALALLGIVGIVTANNQIADRESEKSTLEARQQAAEVQIQRYAAYGSFASISQQRQATITSLAQSRFDWQRVMNELARVIPDDVWLESLTGKVSPAVSINSSSSGSSASDSSTTDASVTGPSLALAGCGAGQEAVAKFVAALKDIDGVTRVGLQQSSLPDDTSSGTATTDSATSSDTGSGCQTKDFIAHFSITVAFDAVPTVPPAAAATTAPVAAPTGTTTTSTTSTTDDGGVASTEATQQSATDSAAQQSADAQQGAANVGVGG